MNESTLAVIQVGTLVPFHGDLVTSPREAQAHLTSKETALARISQRALSQTSTPAILSVLLAKLKTPSQDTELVKE